MGDQYTPSTDEVRSGSSRYIGTGAFDRWLAAHDAEVAAKAREVTDDMIDAATWAILDRNMDLADRAPSQEGWDETLRDAKVALYAAMATNHTSEGSER